MCVRACVCVCVCACVCACVDACLLVCMYLYICVVVCVVSVFYVRIFIMFECVSVYVFVILELCTSVHQWCS